MSLKDTNVDPDFDTEKDQGFALNDVSICLDYGLRTNRFFRQFEHAVITQCFRY